MLYCLRNTEIKIIHVIKLKFGSVDKSEITFNLPNEIMDPHTETDEVLVHKRKGP